MLDSLQVVEVGESSIVVGYPNPGAEIADVAEGNILGRQAGRPGVARDFLGLPDNVVNRLATEIQTFNEVDSEDFEDQEDQELLALFNSLIPDFNDA